MPHRRTPDSARTSICCYRLGIIELRHNSCADELLRWDCSISGIEPFSSAAVSPHPCLLSVPGSRDLHEICHALPEGRYIRLDVLHDAQASASVVEAAGAAYDEVLHQITEDFRVRLFA